MISTWLEVAACVLAKYNRLVIHMADIGRTCRVTFEKSDQCRSAHEISDPLVPNAVQKAWY